MEQIHALDGGEAREYGDVEMAAESYPPEDLEMLVAVSEPHRGLMERILDIEDVFVFSEIIIKNASRSNDYIFFSVVDGIIGLIFVRLREAIVHDECIL